MVLPLSIQCPKKQSMRYKKELQLSILFYISILFNELFDDNFLSFVTYDNIFLYNEDSSKKSETIYFSSNSQSDSLCDNINPIS